MPVDFNDFAGFGSVENIPQPEGTMSKIKYGLVNGSDLQNRIGVNPGSPVFCHRSHTDRCGCACAAFQVTEDKDGKKVAVLHCFPEPRELDVEFEIQEDSAQLERERRERLLEEMAYPQSNLRPGVYAEMRATGLPPVGPSLNEPLQRLDPDVIPDVIRDLDGDDNPRTNGGG